MTGLDVSGDAALQCANLVLSSDLQKVPALAKDLEKLRSIRSTLIHKWRKAANDANSFETDYFRRIGKFEGQAPPMTASEIATADAIRERLADARSEFRDEMGHLFNTREAKMLVLKVYYEKYLVPHLGVTAVKELIRGSEHVWGRALKNRQGKPLGRAFDDLCDSFEERCYSEFAKDYCGSLKFAIDKLPHVSKERLIEVIPLTEKDICFTSASPRVGNSSYQSFLNKWFSSKPNARLDAIVGNEVRLLPVDGRISELQASYLNLFNSGATPRQLSHAESLIVETQVSAIHSESGIASARYAFARLIAESDFESAVRHPVVVSYCKLTKDHIKLIHAELKTQEPLLKKQWAEYMQQGALQAFKNALSPSDYYDVEEVIRGVEMVDMKTYFTPSDLVHDIVIP